MVWVEEVEEVVGGKGWIGGEQEAGRVQAHDRPNEGTAAAGTRLQPGPPVPGQASAPSLACGTSTTALIRSYQRTRTLEVVAFRDSQQLIQLASSPRRGPRSSTRAARRRRSSACRRRALLPTPAALVRADLLSGLLLREVLILTAQAGRSADEKGDDDCLPRPLPSARAQQPTSLVALRPLREALPAAPVLFCPTRSLCHEQLRAALVRLGEKARTSLRRS